MAALMGGAELEGSNLSTDSEQISDILKIHHFYAKFPCLEKNFFTFFGTWILRLKNVLKNAKENFIKKELDR